MNPSSTAETCFDDTEQEMLTRRFVWHSVIRMVATQVPLILMMSTNFIWTEAWREYPVIAWTMLIGFVLIPITSTVYVRRQLGIFRERSPRLTADLISSSVQRKFASPLDPFTTFDVCAEKLSSIVVGMALGYDKPAAFRQEPFNGVITVGRVWPFWMDGAIRVNVEMGQDRATDVTVRSLPGLRRLMIPDGRALSGVETVCGLLRAALRERVEAQEAKIREQSLERTALQARLNALQAQVEPHFLFNTLANLKHLIRTDEIRAQEMVDHLVGYLHASLPDLRSASSTVAREVELAEHYLHIMQIRMGARLHYRCDIAPDTLECTVPPAMLISLVENAIKHGLERATRPGHITISCRRQGAMLTISVRDDGAGLAEQAGEGLGLANIVERLKLLYDGKARLTVQPAQPSGVEARLAIPVCASEGA